MNETNLLLKAYYEALYDLLEDKRELLARQIDKLLREEIEKFVSEKFNEKKYTAYKDACFAFVDERLETYNPIGFQYTFDRIGAKQAIELELQLNWFDSRAEFQNLTEAVCNKAEVNMTDERIRELAEEITKELGAFPDKSIISAYRAEPALGKLPDYIVALAIEESII